MEQELPTLPEQSSSPPPPGFSGVRVTRSLVLYVCFLDRCLSFCTYICNFASGNSKLLSMSSIKRPYLRGKQTQILRGNGSAKMISMAMQFTIINLEKNIESIHF